MREHRINTEDLDLQPDDRRAVETAQFYREFPAIKDPFQRFETILDSKERGEEFSREMENVLASLRAACDIVTLAINNQETYGLVDKRWMRDTASLQQALERGRLVMELDVRLDREGEFWVSHAVGARASLFPPFIHRMTTEEMEKKSRRFHLGEGFDEFAPYKDRGHRLILELKTLGPDPETFPATLQRLEKLLKEKDLENSVAVASLSPGILMATHEQMPRMPLILNGGIVPGISYTEQGKNLIEGIVPADRKWRAIGIPRLGEVVVSAGERAPRRPDGEGTQTGYALTRLPQELVAVMREQRQGEQKFGGLASLSAVTILASTLEAVGARGRAADLRKFYSDIVSDLGLGKMATTWGQGLAKVPGFRQLAPKEQLKVFKRELGLNTVVYTKSPELWAASLPSDVQKLLAE